MNTQVKNGDSLTSKYFKVMARPIEPTPILTGKDAKRFLHRMEEGRKIPIEEMEQMMRDYEELRKITRWR